MMVAAIASVVGAATTAQLRRAQLSVHLTAKERYGITLLLATGSERPRSAARRAARCTPQWYLDQLRAAQRNKNASSPVGRRRHLRALGLPFIEPELRESNARVQMALKGKLPTLVDR